MNAGANQPGYAEVRMRATAMALLMLVASASLAAGQDTSRRSGHRRLLDRQTEIALARSAAPPSVSAAARVYVLTRNGYVVADPGTSGAACYVGRSWLDSIEPHCYDAEGAATIMPMEMRRVELYSQGRSREEVERVMADGLLDGTWRLPGRPAVTYMMSAAQVLFDDNGKHVGQWKPHLMIFTPFLTNEAIGVTGEPDIRGAMVNGPGTAEANLMVIVKDFIQPAASPTGRP
jgi:hypothetical protein